MLGALHPKETAMLPRRIVLLVVAAMAMVVASCATDDDTVTGPPTTTTPPAVPAEVVTLAPGVLTVCVDGPFEPFKLLTEDGQWSGFEMDLLAEIAGGIGDGLPLTVVERPFDGIWRQPGQGACDLAAASMTITDQRATEARFSDPYYDSAQSLLVRVDDSDVTSLAGLAGATVGVQAGTTGEAYAAANAPAGTNLVAYDTTDGLMAALDNGEVDAVVHDLPLNLARVRAQPQRLRVTAQFLTGEQYGYAAASDNTALIDAVNAGLAEARTSGTYQTLYNRYFTTGS